MQVGVALSVLGLLSINQAPKPPAVVSLPPPPIPMVSLLQADYKTLPDLPIIPYPVAAPETYPNTYEWGNCTWYVAGRIKVPETWGNANTWATSASAEGYTVSSVPVVGSIAVSTLGYYGHVAIVGEINNNEVRIDEMNVLGLGVASSRWVSTSSFVYIYV